MMHIPLRQVRTLGSLALLLALSVPGMRAQTEMPDKQTVAQNSNSGTRESRTYRLVYTLTDSDGGKRLGQQRYTMTIVSNGRANLKQGSKVPVMTGGYVKEGTPDTTQFQFTYLDVGLSLDATLMSNVDGLNLKTIVEQSSLVDAVNPHALKDPAVLQTKLENSALVKLGVPTVIGSFDVPASTHHLEIEVTLHRMP